MATSPLMKVRDFGQSIWLDFIRRGILLSGELQSFVDNDGIVGVTSNPSIFEKAIVGSRDYDVAIREASSQGLSAKDIYESITVFDIQKAADIFTPTFARTKALDGFVSLEVSPHLAHDSEGTMVEARRLWKTVARPNLLVKVPATKEGLVAIKQLIAEGISVNVTLLFGLGRYGEVIEAYLSGLESRSQEGKSIKGIRSVASFFISRIDTEIDRLLPSGSAVSGKVAIACAKLAYRQFKEVFAGERFSRLAKQGAEPQRLLWASTSTKSLEESDVKYVDALIGPDTVDTIPLATLNAYRDHGHPSASLEENLPEAVDLLQSLVAMNISVQDVTQNLEDEGVRKFSVAFDKLITSIELKRLAAINGKKNLVSLHLTNCEEPIKKRLLHLQDEQFTKRIWRGDASLWKSDSAAQAQIRNSLGWLHIAEKMEKNLKDINDFVQAVRNAGFSHVVHMGMGGSSLAPLVFARTFSCAKGLPLSVLDSTAPESIQAIEKQIQIETTLFIVASKSGATAEPNAFMDYFFAKVKNLKGDGAGENFVAITDANTSLDHVAKELKFRRVFRNAPDIGGRYSALSYFGLIPAALLGVNITEFLDRTLLSVQGCFSGASDSDSPGLVLGAALGQMALQGKNKVTLIADQKIGAVGLWLEQLMAESTGKEGKGLIPVSDESLGLPESYGADRLFIYIKVKTSRTSDEALRSEEKILALQKAGQAVVTIDMADEFDLGREFFLWEFATAVAGSILEINPFDQPNVQESKDNTDRLLSQQAQHRPKEEPKHSEGCLSIYAKRESSSIQECLLQLFSHACPGDYVALLAFLPESEPITTKIQSIRTRLRDKLKLATTFGYGPRFLHSTGQLHKGGPATGVFMQLTADAPFDLAIPGKPYSFAYFKQAQAEGDLEALRTHGRRVVRIHLGGDLVKGLAELERLIDKVLEAM